MSGRSALYVRLCNFRCFDLLILALVAYYPRTWSELAKFFCLMVRMFEFRTIFLNFVVWLVAVSQLLLQPATALLHFGCEGHPHVLVIAEKPSSQPHDFWNFVVSAWHRVMQSDDCQHWASTGSVSVCEAKTATSHRHSSGTPCSCCSPKTHQAERQDSSSGDSPGPEHKSHQCPICQVVFAARVNTVIAKLPVQTCSVPLAVCEAMPVADFAPCFALPSRGPPAV